MPKKPRNRKTDNRSASSVNDLWIAPRRTPATATPQIFGPDAAVSTSRFLEFADIALGVKTAAPRRKKSLSDAGHDRRENKREAEVVPIDGPAPARRGFGAFRNSR
jgi:hypothetical protein